MDPEALRLGQGTTKGPRVPGDLAGALAGSQAKSKSRSGTSAAPTAPQLRSSRFPTPAYAPRTPPPTSTLPGDGRCRWGRPAAPARLTATRRLARTGDARRAQPLRPGVAAPPAGAPGPAHDIGWRAGDPSRTPAPPRPSGPPPQPDAI
jgi:hypothetical protein